MADADRALGLVPLDLDAQGLEPAHAFFNVDFFAVKHGDACGIISAIFQFTHPVEQDRTSLFRANITYNTTHSGPPVKTLMLTGSGNPDPFRTRFRLPEVFPPASMPGFVIGLMACGRPGDTR